MTALARPNAFDLAADVYDPPPWEPAGRPPLEPHQVPPAELERGEADTWLLEAGRGAGKTEACARFYTRYMRQHPGSRGRIIAPTFGDAVEACVEGPSGLLSIDSAVRWLPSHPGGSKVIWPNGSEALVIGTPRKQDVDRLRAGGNRHIDWWEEMAANPQLGKAWDMAQMGLRLGPHPIAIASTTPRTSTAYKQVRLEPGVIRTHATMLDNPHNPDGWVRKMLAKYQGTRLGKQEITGQLLEDIEGALWRLAWIEDTRVRELPYGGWQRMPTVGCDPSDGSEDGAEHAYTVVGLASNDHELYVVESEGLRCSPTDFARQTIRVCARHHGQIVLEKNHGGQWMVDIYRRAMKDLGAFVPLKVVHASESKLTRAEPVAGLYEPRTLPGRKDPVPGRVHHVGVFEELEEQMTTWTGASGETSPDRLDSLVWALHPYMEASFAPPPRDGDKAVPYSEPDPDLYDPENTEGAVAWQ
jgi:phage terminase large subunit-like protein